MKTYSVALLCCLMLCAAGAYAQMEAGYQMAHIVSFEKTAADAQHMSDADAYKINMRMNGTVYSCRGNGTASTFMDWSMGKELPAKVSPDGKVLTVKSPNGEVVNLKVVKKSSK